MWWVSNCFEDRNVLEYIVSLLITEKDQLHPGYNTEIFYAQNSKYDFEKYFKSSTAEWKKLP